LEAVRIRHKLLIIPGYFIGIGCLFLITQRTLLAFFSETKAVTISINAYGEQYLDLISLVVLWIICFFGLFLLIKIKDEKPEQTWIHKIHGKTVINEEGVCLGVLRDSVVDRNTGSLVSILVDPSTYTTSHIENQGNTPLIFSYDSIKSIDEVIVIKNETRR